MGTGFARHPLVDRINDAFRRDQIAQSADRLANINPNADALDYLHTLGLFQFDPGVTLEGYRTGLGIPAVNLAVLTLAIQTAVRNRTPLKIGIVSGDSEQIQITTRADGKIYVLLTRKE